MRTSYFHEDDDCQIELLPAGNLDWCRSEVARIDDFSRQHRDGIGWTEMVLREEPPVPLASREIGSVDACTALSSVLPPFRRVTSGYSTYVKEVASTRAFGYQNEIVVYVESQGDVVSAIWLALQPTTLECVRSAEKVLSLCRRWKLLLVDWSWSVVIPLDDSAELETYLQRRLDRFAASVPPPEKAGWRQRLRRWLGAR